MFQLHQSPGGNISQPAAILTSQSLHEHDMAVRNASIASSANPAMSLVSSNPNALQSGAQIPSSPSKPSILRRREIEREPLGKFSIRKFICSVNIFLQHLCHRFIIVSTILLREY